jgi:ATP-dependent Clp protease ATP-binding subunit ClpC
MGKVNVYLPDDLEREVRDAELSVSAICQTALRDALDRVAGARAGDAARAAFTARLATILDDAGARMATEGKPVSALEVLCSIIKHGENLGARALTMLGVELPDTRPVRGGSKAPAGALGEDARSLLVAATRIALDMRHNYVGTEHVVIACAADDAMRDLFGALGIEQSTIRRQVERLLANPWTSEAEPTAVPAELLDRLETEVARLASELGRLKGEER